MKLRRIIAGFVTYAASVLSVAPRELPAQSTQSTQSAQSVPSAQSEQSEQSLDDAWWTGPVAASSAGTLPRGHYLIEPYFFDVIAPHSHYYGSLTYLILGLGDHVAGGLIPTFGYNSAPGASSSHVGVGDLGMIGQYRFTQFHRGSAVPTISFVVQENLPTGKYDKLGDRPGDGMGSGAYKTTVSLYSQTYFWMPTGRILRARLNASESFSNHPTIDNVSVYGTPQGFHGTAKPGNSFFGDLAGEYSVTRNWVLAMDLLYVSSGSTFVSGITQLPAGPAQRWAANSGSSMSFGFIPAIEYNFTGNLGVIAGTRIFKGNRSTVGTTTPVVAINFVR